MTQGSTGASRVLTLVFTDIVDSTALKSEKGDEAAGQLIGRHRSAVQSISSETQGRIIDWAGDGCFQTFDTPSAAVRFALGLRAVHSADGEMPEVRTGIHMGEVTESAADDGSTRVEGLAVDIAARIESLALPGQILLSTSVFNSARQRLNSREFDQPVAWSAHGAYLFKGFDDPMEVGEVGFEGTSPLTAPAASEKAQRATAPTEEDTLGWRPAAGQTIPGRPHWTLDEQLGVGGYGEVWLASNVNTHDKHVFKFCFQPDRLRGLKREVVLFRLLKESLGERDDIARVLDWDLENQPYFIETEYTEGGDLKIWAEQKGGIAEVPLETRLELVAQVATAMGAAHSAGVLHKDIKPANILISEQGGTPKACLTDFGIGLLTDPNALKEKGITATGLTKTLVAGKSSSTSGTAMYLAPELHEGKPPSEKSDIYGLGVVLYQMATGDLNHAMAAGWERDIEDPLLRDDIAACVDGNPDHRFATAEEVAGRLRSLEDRRATLSEQERTSALSASARERGQRRSSQIKSGLIALTVIAIIGGLAWMLLSGSTQQSRETWAREALPELRTLVEDGQYVEAFGLAGEIAEHLPDDPTLAEYLHLATNTIAVQTRPPGATIAYKPYVDPDAPWIELGVSPLKNLEIPIGHFRWRIRKEGHDDRDVVETVMEREIWDRIGALSGAEGQVFMFDLPSSDDTPEGMIQVDGGVFMVGLAGFVPGVSFIPPFFIDHTEVTNREYQSFVDAGGYENPEFWEHPFVREGSTLSFEEAMSRFKDATGQSGPGFWELGDYLDGEANMPIRGVSWFEAAAYAKFKGRSLPSLSHWSRAAHVRFEMSSPLSPLVTAQSNFGESGPAEVGTYSGTGSSGTFDMAGNVREWCWNEGSGGRRYALGGGWNDAPYMYTLPQAQSAWDRFENNGFRCVVYPKGVKGPPSMFEPFHNLTPSPVPEEPISDEVLAIYRERFAYGEKPLRPETRQEAVAHNGWTNEIVSIQAAYDDARFDLHIDLPADAEPPYQAVIFFPGLNALSAATLSIMPWETYEFIPRSGRALIRPVFSGLYDRGDGKTMARLNDPDERVELYIEWARDVGRTIDYLESREDIDTRGLTYIGFSLGASLAPLFLGLEERLEVAVLTSGGLSLSRGDAGRVADPSTYVPSVSIPVLMLNGRHDYVFPLEAAQLGLFEGLGTPSEDKRHILYDAGHAPLPRTEVLRDTLAWLDKYQ